MRCIIRVLATVLALEWFCALAENSVIRKRDLISFGSLIFSETRKFPLIFNEYGNYCGFGGSGDPVDKLDQCCKDHDECYRKFDKLLCNPYLTPYKVNSDNYTTSCDPSQRQCSYDVCECDLEAAKCFAASPYNKENHSVIEILRKMRKLLSFISSG